jgi:excisionase family DNA binding protein
MGVIDIIGVDPDCQQLGIGSLLTEHAIEPYGDAAWTSQSSRPAATRGTRLRGRCTRPRASLDSRSPATSGYSTDLTCALGYQSDIKISAMARVRKQSDDTALFVRIPSEEAAKLHRAADALGAPKRELITRLVAQYVDPDNPTMLNALGSAQADWSVGQHSFRPANELEILTPAQLAGLLQVDEKIVIELAEERELPGRKVGEEWRFSREAILAWLAEQE